jgi:transcription antitermination protein NusB
MSDAAAKPGAKPTPKLPPKLASNGALKPSAKNPRARAREFALQALYQHLVGKNDVDSIDAFTRDLSGFSKCDSVHFDALVHGCVAEAATLDAALSPCLDRPWAEVSPIEHAVLWIGAYEFTHCLDVPWRVVLNECIELAKAFGGTDGHKWVNGVLNQLAPSLRPDEVKRDQSKSRTKAAPNAAQDTPDA